MHNTKVDMMGKLKRPYVAKERDIFAYRHVSLLVLHHISQSYLHSHKVESEYSYHCASKTCLNDLLVTQNILTFHKCNTTDLVFHISNDFYATDRAHP